MWMCVFVLLFPRMRKKLIRAVCDVVGFGRIYFNDNTDDNVRDLIYSHVFCNDPIDHMSGARVTANSFLSSTP